MKTGTRLYINVTNQCNTNCPFCCMYSDPAKQTFMNFDTYQSIIDRTKDEFELQLEGGEPLLHQDLLLFCHYGLATKRCKKLIILTNGLLLEKYLEEFISLANWYQIEIELKVSINYWLLKENENLLKDLSQYHYATQFIPNIHFVFNVRKRKHGDNNIEKLLKEYKLYDHSNIFYFQSYGKLKDSDYEKPVIVQNIDNWRIFASDGTCFGQELILRSEYEKNLK